jgi:GTP-binding protein HflX
MSAKKGIGVELLLTALAEYFHQEHVHRVVRLGPEDGRLRARLFQSAKVLSEQPTDQGGWEMELEMPRREYERLLRQETALEKRLIA